MKRVLFVLIGVTLSQLLFSQDVIIKKNGDEIEAKVLEITLDVIKYKKHDNPEGPTISILKKDVFMIKYENGTKDVLSEEEEKKEEPKDDGPRKTTVTYSKVEYQRTVTDREIYNLVKVAPLLIFGGEIPLFYERRLSDHISLEGGIGITHQDYVYAGFNDEFGSTDDTRRPNFGYTISSSLHYYPGQYIRALDEAYFGPEIRLKQYNTEFVKCGSTTISPGVSEFRRLFDVKLSGGYIQYVGDRVFFDWYASLGIRFRTIKEAQCNATGPIVVSTSTNTTSNIGPAISLGFKFGFGL